MSQRLEKMIRVLAALNRLATIEAQGNYLRCLVCHDDGSVTDLTGNPANAFDGDARPVIFLDPVDARL